MTIDELISRLEEYRDALGGETEVRLMTQQNWPFENEITGLASGEEINDACDSEDTDDDQDVDEDAVVYANKSLVSVTVVQPGTRTIRLPRRANVEDAFTGKVLGRGVTEVDVAFDERESKMFFLTGQ